MHDTMTAFFAREGHLLLSTRGLGSPGNREVYRTALRYWRRYWQGCGGEPPLERIGRAELSAFRADLLARPGLRGRPLARATVSLYSRTVRAVLSLAEEAGRIGAAPTLRPLRLARRLPRLVTLEELAKIYEGCRTATMPALSGVPASHWWQALYVACYATALRIGALLSATWGDLDDERLLLRVRGDKTGDERTKPIHPALSAHLERIRGDDPHLFPWPHTSATLYRHARRIWRAAGVPSAARKPFHDVRKTALTAAAVAAQRAVLAAQTLGDHASGQTTRTYYLGTAPALDLQREAVLAMPWPFPDLAPAPDSEILPFRRTS